MRVSARPHAGQDAAFLSEPARSIEHMFDTVTTCREATLDRISSLLAERDRVDAELAAAVHHAEATSAWHAAGAVGAHAFLRSTGGRTAAEVRDVRLLARLLRFDTTRTALGEGALGLPHARALADAVTDARTSLYERDEATLLQQAATLAIRPFETLLAHWAALADQETSEPTADPHQRLWMQHRFDGGADLRGSLDAATTVALRDALDAFDTGPDPVDGPAPRSLAERRADALGDVADAAIGRHDPGAAPAAPRTTTNVVIDVRSLAGRSGDLDGIESHVDGRAIRVATVDRLLCDSWFASIVRDARGVVVDASERSAPFTEAQRRVLAVRDGGCCFPGCDRPPSWCDGHHLQPRSRGGTNELGNAVLVCRRHHTLLHDGWQLTRGPDGAWVATSPHGRTWTGRPAAVPAAL